MLGITLGLSVLSCDGCIEGTDESLFEGSLDGIRDDSNDGEDDILAVGGELNNGDTLGNTLASKKGVFDGSSDIKVGELVPVGDKLGANEGLLEGIMLGKILGISVESSDGCKEGLDDTFIEGSFDGI